MNNIEKKELKENFSDFLNSFLNNISTEHGNYYAKWNGYSLTIVDEDGFICDNSVIYEMLLQHIDEYGFSCSSDRQFSIVCESL